MATVVYLPATKFTKAGSVTKDDSAAKAAKSEKLAELFGNLNKEDSPERNSAIQQNIAGGAIESEGGLMSLISQMRSNKDANNIKIPAFNNKGEEVPFAVSKKDLATGEGETKANKLGFTLTNKGKQVDYFADTPTQKFIGVGSPNKRPPKSLKLDEWKSKYGASTKAKPTDKDKAIGDYIRASKDVNGVQLQNTSINRKRAREFLDKRGKGIEVINTAFGKKTGNDWTIDTPLKNSMAIIAKGQLERFVMDEGMSMEQAGGASVNFVKDMFKDEIDAANAPPDIKDEEGGFLNAIGNLFTADETKSAEKVRKSPDYIGDWNEIPIEVPDTITSPKEAMSHIMKTYNMTKEDARQFLLDNAPTE